MGETRGPHRYPFQRTGAHWLASRDRALLADEQGLGKTVQAVDAADYVMADRILVLCKAVAKANWAREFAKFSPAERPVTIPATTDTIPRRGASVTIINYDIVHDSRILSQLVRCRWDVLICDEMQSLKSGVASRRGQAVLDPDRGLWRTADTVWGLSGTPMPSHAGELYPWLSTLHADLLPDLPSYEDFLDRYVEYQKTDYGIRVFRNRHGALRELRERIHAHLLRRRRTEVLPELPPLAVDDLAVDSADALAALDDWTEHPEFIELDAAVRSAHDPEDIQAAAQASTLDLASMRRLIGSVKVKPLAGHIIAELEQDPALNIVIMAWHRDVIDAYAEALADYAPVTLHGGTSQNLRQTVVDTFQSATTPCRVMIGQITAAGTSINLTASHRLIFAEASWAPGDNEQAMLRILRIGQDHPCRVSFANLAGSIDEALMRVYARKAQMVSEALE